MTLTPKYVLRGGIENNMPQYSVVRLNDDMGGTTVAFFYRLRDAKRYMKWMNGERTKKQNTELSDRSSGSLG